MSNIENENPIIAELNSVESNSDVSNDTQSFNQDETGKKDNSEKQIKKPKPKKNIDQDSSGNEPTTITVDVEKKKAIQRVEFGKHVDLFKVRLKDAGLNDIAISAIQDLIEYLIASGLVDTKSDIRFLKDTIAASKPSMATGSFRRGGSDRFRSERGGPQGRPPFGDGFRGGRNEGSDRGFRGGDRRPEGDSGRDFRSERNEGSDRGFRGSDRRPEGDSGRGFRDRDGRSSGFGGDRRPSRDRDFSQKRTFRSDNDRNDRRD